MEFTRQPNGMEDEYQKVLERTKRLLRANGRTKGAWNEMLRDLRQEERNIYDIAQIAILEVTLKERALHEMENNWNNKEYWGEE